MSFQSRRQCHHLYKFVKDSNGIVTTMVIDQGNRTVKWIKVN